MHPNGLDITTQIAAILSCLKDLTDQVPEESRRRGFTFQEGAFPTFNEMDAINTAIANPKLLPLAQEVLRLLDWPASDTEPRDEQCKSLLSCIARAGCYPDLFQREHTAERISNAIQDLQDGYVTVLTSTVISGILPTHQFELGNCQIHPLARWFYPCNWHSVNVSWDMWLQAQVPWGALAMGSGQAIIFMEERVKIPKTPGNPPETEPTSRIVQALRLATGPEVHSVGTIQKCLVFGLPHQVPGNSQFRPTGVQWWRPAHHNFRRDGIRFTPAHTHEAACMLKVLDNDKSPLSAPIRRFDMAMRRSDAKDRLVDLAIAAESLFLGKDDKELIGYRLRMRAARLMTEPERRHDMAKRITEIYGIRSSIVHGERESAKGSKEMTENVTWFAEFIRESIRHGAHIHAKAGHAAACYPTTGLTIPKLADELLLGIPAAEEFHRSASIPRLPSDQIDGFKELHQI